MINPIPPFAVYIIGALLIPFIRNSAAKRAFLLLIPVVSFINLINIPMGSHFIVPFLDFQLIFAKIDKLSLIFGYIFHLVTVIAVIYALHVKDNLQHVAAYIYGGSALGVTFAGDLFSLFVFWELLTIGSVFLIWTNRTQQSLNAGFRYALYHIVGGLVLLSGILMYVHSTGSIEFKEIGLQEGNLATYLIFIGFGINCAWPILHPWVTDAYPESTITGIIFLSAFTTKTAVYALARAYPGTSILIWIGAAMACFAMVYAVIENDLRRVLSYSLINQVGFMVVGIGIGTNLAMNGAISHAVNDILFKALLFMSIGAVMYRTGKSRCTDLGGLYRTMPLTCIFCIIGAASISGFPLFSAFVSKSMIISAAGQGGMVLLWFLLMFASTGVLEHAGIKVPFFAFFSHDSGLRPQEAPSNMLIAMGIAAFFCIFIGTFPGPLYSLLPYPVEYHPYTMTHVVTTTILLLFASLAFVFLLFAGVYPPEMRAINLDADWFWRKGSNLVVNVVTAVAGSIAKGLDHVFIKTLPVKLAAFSRRPISGMMKEYKNINVTTGPLPETNSMLMPAGVPVLISVAFILILALVFLL
ncbi:MAG: Na(+)/H(+) antiporter subunit D [Deltaproteobacteria bacterium]|nr:Na(+)/H(+) antiporter subunit D [Deltaproteobacteria bacterium]